MIITRNPAATLELCFVVEKLQPENLGAVKESDYVVRGGQRNRIKWDKEGRIVFVPPERHDVKETKPSRAGTTNRVANKTLIGQVVAAAENQPQGRADWLRFLYDPECPASVTRRVREMARARMMSLIPEKHEKKRERAKELVDPLLLHFSQMLRCGIERYSESDLCKYMGFVNVRDASYAKEYRRIVGAFLLQLQDLEVAAMRPVVNVLHEIFQEPGIEEAPRHYSGPSAANEEEEAGQQLLRRPSHPSVLSINKNKLASI